MLVTWEIEADGSITGQLPTGDFLEVLLWVSVGRRGLLIWVEGRSMGFSWWVRSMELGLR